MWHGLLYYGCPYTCKPVFVIGNENLFCIFFPQPVSTPDAQSSHPPADKSTQQGMLSLFNNDDYEDDFNRPPPKLPEPPAVASDDNRKDVSIRGWKSHRIPGFHR